jgi:shikimate kinase
MTDAGQFAGSSGRHVVLVGLMGAGKTTVGQRCAELLERPFVDTDELVVAAAGVPFDDIWSAEGEQGFRLRERLAVADAAASPTPLVISCGGGAVLDAENRRALRARGVVVLLTASSAALASRLSNDNSRPLLIGDDKTATLERLSALRQPAYEAAAHLEVDTENRSVDDVAATVVKEFSAWNG